MPNQRRRLISKKFSRILVALALLISILVAISIVVTVIAERTLSRFVLGGLGESFSTRVYSAPFAISNGDWVSPETIEVRLKRLHYRRVPGIPRIPGEYSWTEPELKIFLQGFESPVFRQSAFLVNVVWGANNGFRLVSNEGTLLPRVFLEPELAMELSGSKRIRREPASWEEFPPALIAAVVLAEDRRFFSHWGIDPVAMTRALMHNIRKPTLHGASTITQQLAKNLFLSPKRTIRRKLTEVLFALYLELRYSKEQIMTIYLNHIYMSQDGPISVAGMKAAARFFFDEDISRISIPQAALLAGVIRSPYRYNPWVHPESAKARRDSILKRLLEHGVLNDEEFLRAVQTPLKVAARKTAVDDGRAAEYYVAEIVRRLVPSYGEDVLVRYGLSIYSHMDPVLQETAQRIVSRQPNQAALVAMNPQNGAVLALSGGKDYRESQFNRATQAQRQPGSAFKPFVFGAALDQGLTLATVLTDELKTYTGNDGKPWTPHNFDDTYHGNVTMREALAFSLNAATVQLAEKIGPKSIIDFAARMGISSPLENSLALALGVSEVNPLELTSAYAPFANGGYRVEPALVTAVVDSDGVILNVPEFRPTVALEPEKSYLMTSLLESVVLEGTARSLMSTSWPYPTAGKTGTTNLGRDAWFIGYSPGLLAGVWTGEDAARPLNLTGSKNALPIWKAFMTTALADSHRKEFPKPRNMITVQIDPISGGLAVSGCPRRVVELFESGTAPAFSCPLHKGGVMGFFKRLFGKNKYQ